MSENRYSEPVVELKHVSFAYHGTPVLEDVNLTVEHRDFLSVVGPNGGGKTTILKLILGLIKPAAGTVRLFGASPEKTRHRIGYMPQYTSLDPLFPVSVLDVVLMGRLGKGMNLWGYSKSDRRCAEEALEKVEMAHLRERPFFQLSGGQFQRVLLARALVSDPDLLLLDEPTSNVDAAIETGLYELLHRLNEKLTIILVTHDLGFVSHYVDKVACVNRRLLTHPTCEITGEMISAVYGSHVHMIRHDAKERDGVFS
ncbi:MAG: metal ABC transporter ATP-binding protein [Desulfomonilia bacterium]